MTPYNARHALKRAAEADVHVLRDPGSGGTVQVDRDLCVLVIESTGGRTLQAASQVALNTEVLCCATASSVTVNSVDINDGDYAIFRVTLTAAGANQWTVVSSTNLGADLEAEVDLLHDGVRTGTVTAETDTATITAAEVLGGFILGTPVSAATYTLPTAALLVAAIPNASVGMIIRFSVHNAGADADAITLAAGSGATDEGTLTVAQDVTRDFVITITNVTAASEAYILYGIG